MHITNISEAKSSLSALIALVEQGQEIIIGKAGKPVARLIPYQADQADRVLGGSWEGKVKIADDFDTLPAEIMSAFQGYGTL
ncbi:MAG: type II toxin-antitoxin system Phd/YefM family antitoxin [Thiofilum sp.]|nr:type II toxin-antitoxin system Phd/YefM family antitoxin [Thiofilum sp.]